MYTYVRKIYDKNTIYQQLRFELISEYFGEPFEIHGCNLIC